MTLGCWVPNAIPYEGGYCFVAFFNNFFRIAIDSPLPRHYIVCINQTSLYDKQKGNYWNYEKQEINLHQYLPGVVALYVITLIPAGREEPGGS